MRSAATRSALIALSVSVALVVPSGVRASDQYEYDAAGRLSRVTHHTGQIVDYTYDGNSNILTIITSLAVSVEPSPEGRIFFNALGATKANPVSREARFQFSLARSGTATIRCFNVAGRLVHTATSRDYGAGEYEARVQVTNWPAGVYFYRLEAPGFTQTRRFVVLR
jgi:YD repeat-containing protein